MSRIREALQLFKQLHRTSQKVFSNDVNGLTAAQVKIREEFDKNKDVSEAKAVEELLKFGHEVNTVLAKKVVQLEQIEEHKFKANIRQDLEFGENTIYRDDISEEEYKAKNRQSKKRGKCSDVKQNPE